MMVVTGCGRGRGLVMSATGSVYSWCRRRDPASGGRMGSRCPRWASTILRYAAHVRLYLKPCLGRILLADLSVQHVQACSP
jgi:hypothetical protein